MNVSKFKDAIKGISVFKNYSSLLVPVAVVLAAVLLFIPTLLMSSSLRKQIQDESISNGGDQVKFLLGSTAPRSQVVEEQKYRQAQGRDANEITFLAKQSTQRRLLSGEIFPEPKDTSTLIFEGFGRKFCEAVRELITRLNAGECPTEMELERGAQKRTAWRGGTSYRHKAKLKGEVKAAIIDALCREKAESASVYANPANLGGYKFWEEYKYSTSGSWNNAIEDCWYSQLAYWIIEDVVDTIGTLNSGSNTVLTSKVKRLLGVSFVPSDKRARSRFGSVIKKEVRGDKPSYVLSMDDGLTKPCTGRISQEDDGIDVVHFSIAVVVGTKAVSSFMQELCSAKQHTFEGWNGKRSEPVNLSGFKHNQITVLEYKIASIKAEDNAHRLYRYGEDAVVNLDLTCEYIFSESSYDEVKPEVVKESVKELLKKIKQEEAKRQKRLRRLQRRPAAGEGVPSTDQLLKKGGF